MFPYLLFYALSFCLKKINDYPEGVHPKSLELPWLQVWAILVCSSYKVAL